MKIAAVSDLHGQLSHSIPECDVLAIVGDIVPLYSSAEDWHQWQELQWLQRKFLKWLKRQPFHICLIVWGNHDIVGCSPDTRTLAKEMLESIDGVIVLDHDFPSIVIDGWRFSGYPYTPTIHQRNWAFSLPRGDERVMSTIEHFIHPETDVLLSHGPPFGVLDLNDDRENCGCAALMHRIMEIAPRFIFCGHIHEARGQRAWVRNLDGTESRIINVSMCNRNYTVTGAKVQWINPMH